MKPTNLNIEKLKKHLVTINDKGKSYCINITTLGHLIYILNDGIGRYVLLVPNKKLTIEDSNKILNLNGWSEKFTLTNFHKNYDTWSSNILLDEIEIILNDILNVPTERNWRFAVNAEMMVVKANEISLDTTSRREINKARANSTSRRVLNFLKVHFSSNFNTAITVTIIFGFIILFNEKSTNDTIDLKLLPIILGMGLLYYIILQLRWPNKK